MANKNQFTTKQFIQAIPGTGGIIATIAKRIDCDWHTAKKYVTEYATVKRAYENECAGIDDLAVSTVIKAIRDGDVATAKWWLGKKRKSEFGETLDIDIPKGSNLDTLVRIYIPENNREKNDTGS